MKIVLISLLLFLFHSSALSAVILQYHHVSETTPKSTSIIPAQFEAHLKYLKTHNFDVVPLSYIIEKAKNKVKVQDKTVAITFDDAYINILTHAKPILDKYNYPYTIFVNPGVINRNLPSNLSWDQLNSLAEEGVIIANHGLEHDSVIRITDNYSKAQWRAKHTKMLLEAEDIIKEKTGQSWRYYSYPYGEYGPLTQKWLKDNNFIGFTQQSGAIGLHTDLTSVPRFPASMPYDELTDLKDKLTSLPFNISLQGNATETVFEYKQTSSITFNIEVDDFVKADLNCYISGLGKQVIQWQGDNQFSIQFSDNLPIGRVRCNCTAPSISKPGQHYWYSKPWFILKKEGEWYAL